MNMQTDKLIFWAYRAKLYQMEGRFNFAKVFQERIDKYYAKEGSKPELSKEEIYKKALEIFRRSREVR